MRKNHPDDVKEMTLSDFGATVDDSIYYLYNRRRQHYMGLHGVRIPVGSAILHWFHECRYPILDINAKWSVQLNESQYRSQYKNKFERWKAYVEFCKAIADEYEVDMRTLDRVLLEYGKAKRPSSC